MRVYEDYILPAFGKDNLLSVRNSANAASNHSAGKMAKQKLK